MYNKILVVSLNNPHIRALSDSLRGAFDITEAENCLKAAEYLNSLQGRSILVLISMDFFRQDEYNLINKKRENIMPETIPVICLGKNYINEAERMTDEMDALAKGAIDFWPMPYDHNLVKLQLYKRFEAQSRELSLMAQLQVILKNFSGGITAAYAQNGRIHYVYTNDEFYGMFGYTKEQYEEELGGNFFSMILPEYLPDVREALHQSAINTETVQMEYQARKRDGNVIWVHGRNTFCWLEDVENPVFITIYEDITLQKNAEERIKTINDRLGNSEIFIQLDITNQILEDYHSKYDNEKRIDRVGKTYQEIEDFVLESVYPYDRNMVVKELSFANLNKYYTDGETKFSIEYRRCMPSGEIRWFCSTVVLLEGVANGTVNALIYCHDINHKMKKKIASQKIINADVDDIYIVNIASNMVHTMKLHIGSFLNLGEMNYQEMIEKYIQMEVAEEDKLRCLALFAMDNILTEVNNNGEYEFSFWSVNANGENCRNSIHIVYLDMTHDDLLMVGRDITVLFEKEQEQQTILRQAAEIANAANRAKSDFLSRMSHDMRTPLNAIIGLTDLAKQKYNNHEMTEFVDSIYMSSQYLLGLINDTLDLSKIESGKMELHKEPYPCEEFLRGLNTVIKPLMDAKDIEFVMNLKHKKNNIVVDKLRFNQIFYNLLSNAAKYTPNRGWVEFATEDIPEKGDKYGIRFFVRDNGIGMSANYLKVLFDPFSQENRPAHSEQKGTGLGLAIVKKIVDLSGGTISVKSEVNEGTEFMVDLYVDNEENYVPDQKEEKFDESKLKDMHILLVDDTEINAMITERTLVDKGCIVDLAYNGLEAVQMFAASKNGFYDLIMTDVRMPIMDGLEEARQIRAMHRKDAKYIPIIGATADAYTEDQDITLAAGINARLVKPIKPTELYKIILALTGK